jgi:AraC family transcriptional regulator of adaptative response/methylated-DNA-[protein]-cysteine methyltransferase
MGRAYSAFCRARDIERKTWGMRRGVRSGRVFHVKHLQNITDEERWQAVLAKDRRYDGAFVTGVHSTGIYCRPSCPARAPLRKNVRFYPSPKDAEQAGLRPCKRCSPDHQSAEEACVLAAIAAIRRNGAMTLEALADLTGYTPTHFQRLFTRSVGLSPAAFARALREERVRDALSSGENVARSLEFAGYSGPKQFYAQTKGRLGMVASDWSRGGAGRIVHWAVLDTSLGPMLVAATEKGVCCLAFGEGEAELRARFPKAQLVPAGEDFRDLFAQVLAAVEQPGPGSSAIPLDVKGTAFQQRVWEELRRIPAGETRSYGELAAALGNPKASRAVGGANGANNVAVLIPCHRVIAADGTLGGYAYGLEIKAELLRREGAD